MNRHNNSWRATLAVVFFWGTGLALHAQVLLDFETSQTGSFRTLSAGGTIGQTSNGASNDYMTSVGGSASASLVYDANGAGAGISNFAVSQSSSLTVSLDLACTTNNSLGIYIINAANETQGYLAILNVNSSGANDQLRFANNAVPTTAGAGTLVNGSFANNADLGYAPQASPFSSFKNLTLNYSINGSSNPVLTFYNGATLLSTLTLSGTAFTDVEVGLRFNSNFGTIGADNFSITATSVPEPSSFALMAAGAGLFAVLRRFSGARRQRDGSSV
jgi:hypothetical protein